MSSYLTVALHIILNFNYNSNAMSSRKWLLFILLLFYFLFFLFVLFCYYGFLFLLLCYYVQKTKSLRTPSSPKLEHSGSSNTTNTTSSVCTAMLWGEGLETASRNSQFTSLNFSCLYRVRKAFCTVSASVCLLIRKLGLMYAYPQPLSPSEVCSTSQIKRYH